MNRIIRKDILNILDNLLKYFPQSDNDSIESLKKLSNRTIHNASIFQDQDSVSIAVVVYSFSKLMEQGLDVDEQIIRTIRSAYNQLLDFQWVKYRKRIKHMLSYLGHIDKKFNKYIEKVIKHAMLKKGSRIYYHGISLAQAASIMGLSQWELSNYIGRTRIAENDFISVDVSKRLLTARRLFRVIP